MEKTEMKRNFFLTKMFFIYVLLHLPVNANTNNYFEEGKKLFNKKDYINSKILFERDLVFNPKSEKSYLYLAKIFDRQENIKEKEINLDNVLLINPNNDEAIYMLILLKIEQSDYSESKDLFKKFTLVCNSFCNKKNEIEKLFKNIDPNEN